MKKGVHKVRDFVIHPSHSSYIIMKDASTVKDKALP
jgi:hypothetical protein